MHLLLHHRKRFHMSPTKFPNEYLRCCGSSSTSNLLRNFHADVYLYVSLHFETSNSVYMWSQWLFPPPLTTHRHISISAWRHIFFIIIYSLQTLRQMPFSSCFDFLFVFVTCSVHWAQLQILCCHGSGCKSSSTVARRSEAGALLHRHLFTRTVVCLSSMNNNDDNVIADVAKFTAVNYYNNNIVCRQHGLMQLKTIVVAQCLSLCFCSYFVLPFADTKESHISTEKYDMYHCVCVCVLFSAARDAHQSSKSGINYTNQLKTCCLPCILTSRWLTSLNKYLNIECASWMPFFSWQTY